MIKLQTPVADEICKVGISYSDKIMMLGSCFSDNIGRQLSDFGFNVCVNPFGTLYNPVSILQSIERLASKDGFGLEDCVQIGAGDERWCSFSHHTSFARTNREEFLANANSALTEARRFFAECNKIIITLGTSWCFRHQESRTIVSNCLKHPASEFIRERLSSQEVTDTLYRIAGFCSASASAAGPAGNNVFKEKEIILTVSPIRHFKDGAHGNQLSKSALLLGIDDFLSETHSGSCSGKFEDRHISDKFEDRQMSEVSEKKICRADYFPAYEIMMDELRDYRFYAEDMCHPSQQAVDYIRERFLEWALPSSEHPRLEENIRSFKRQQHIYKKI